MTAVVAGRAWLRRRQHAAFAEAARQVTVLAPPQAGPAGAAALWGHLTGLLRPRLGHGGGTGSRTWAGSTPGPAATPPG